MLQKIGNRTKTVLGFLLFIPIIGSFLIWGISDMLKAAGVVRYAATVGNTTITTQEFQRDVQRQVAVMKQQGVKVDAETLRNLGVAKQVLRSEIERALLLHAARDNGILINDATLAAEIQKEKAFADDKGKFSKEKFKTLLANIGMSEQQFVSGLREDLEIKTLLGAIEGAAVPPIELPRALYNLQKTKYTADVYALPQAALSSAAAPKDKELADYYAAHQDHYQVPELRRGVLAVLSIKDFESGMAPSDADLKALYDAKKVEFSIPEERSVKFVDVPDEAQAKKIAELARGGEKLDAAASAVTGHTVAIKTMQDVKPGNLPADLDKTLFKLPRGETSEPVNTPLGWYVMQITNIRPGTIPPMDRVRDRLVAAWRDEQASAALPKMLNKLDDAIGGGDSLENLAQTYQLQLHQIPLVDANGQGAAADNITKAAVAAMFKQKQGEIGNVFELPGGDYALLRVDEIRAAHIPPLNEIKAAVMADWKKQKARQLAEELARKLASDWRKSDNLSETISKIGATLTTRSDISRDSVMAKKQPDVIGRAVLRAGSVGEVVTATDGNTEYIAKIRSITVPDKSAIAEVSLSDARAQSTQWVKGDYVQIYLNALEKRYAVEVNEKAVKQIEGGVN